MTKRTVLLLFALTAILPFAAPRRADAIWLDVLTTYYVGSCENLSYNGHKWKECDGTTTQSGTLSGTWRCDDTYDCSGEDPVPIHYYWYERCNNTWVYRYTSAPANRFPTSADCGCT